MLCSSFYATMGNPPLTAHFTEADIASIRAAGRDPEQIAAQAAMLRGKWKSVDIVRPAKCGDGIQQLHTYAQSNLIGLHAEAANAGRISTFVPASGSGTRLFQSFLTLYREHETDLAHVRWRAARGDAIAKDAVVVLDNIRNFALWPALQSRGCLPDSLQQIFQTLFSEGGLRYHELPKGLIPFHRYDNGVRTAFSEHLREAAALSTDGEGLCRVHFTVAASHKALFEGEWRRERTGMESNLRARFQLHFSVQSPQTDTIAVDHRGNIIRDRSGQIVFRPGGHGALLTNLAGADSDLVLIKNIDNVARADFLEEIVSVRRLICGLLLLVEREVHDEVRRLRNGEDPQSAIQLLAGRFGIRPIENLSTVEASREYAIAQLNRPLRVCGVVGTLEHAGGRPFWVKTADRGPTLQIIEGAEVNLNDPHERRVFRRSRHFNPVDMACSIRDVDGEPFDLEQFVVSTRAIIASKVVAGDPARVYEHPGLWNGSMGLWNTMFVEVPDAVFNPVKSLSDLWAPGHRAIDLDE